VAQRLLEQVLEIMAQLLQLPGRVLRLSQLPEAGVAVVERQLLPLVTAVLVVVVVAHHKLAALELLAHRAKDITEALLQLTWVAQLLPLAVVVQVLLV
jgi:hypothetical protein